MRPEIAYLIGLLAGALIGGILAPPGWEEPMRILAGAAVGLIGFTLATRKAS